MKVFRCPNCGSPRLIYYESTLYRTYLGRNIPSDSKKYGRGVVCSDCNLVMLEKMADEIEKALAVKRLDEAIHAHTCF